MKPAEQKIDRTTVALLAAALLLVPSAYVNRQLFDDLESPLSENAFLIRKVHAPAAYDMVLGGNSRMMQGMSPVVMNEKLPGRPILNLGMRGASLTPRMYGLIESKLAPGATTPVVLLGIEPGTLQPSTDASLVVELHRSGEKVFLAQHDVTERIARLFASIRPFKVTNKISLWLNGPTKGQPEYHREYHPDGWSATYWEPEDLERDLKPYRAKAGECCDPGEREPLPFKPLLFEQVRKWASEGILVFGVRIPTAPEVRQYEDQRFDFDEAAISQAFEQAGGIWIAVDPEGYHCYDGGHLHKSSAMAFSRNVADAVRTELERRSGN